MKTIQPVSIWYNGTMRTATIIDVVSTFDDLRSFANFSYKLMEVIPADPNDENSVEQYVTVASGSESISGQDYIDWDNGNDTAIAYVAGKINITIVP